MTPTKKVRRYKRHGRDTVRTQIETLSRSGWRPSAIAEAVGRTTTYVHIALSQMRKSGRLPSRKP